MEVLSRLERMDNTQKELAMELTNNKEVEMVREIMMMELRHGVMSMLLELL